MGCRPDGHLYQHVRLFTEYSRCFSGLSPGWSLVQLSAFLDSVLLKFQWAVARMVTCTDSGVEIPGTCTVSVGCRPDGHLYGQQTVYDFELYVSVGCRPDGHLYQKGYGNASAPASFSGLSPGWSLVLPFDEAGDSVGMFQWAVARMVTCTLRNISKNNMLSVSVGCRPDGHLYHIRPDVKERTGMFQWAVARMVTCTLQVIQLMLF